MAEIEGLIDITALDAWLADHYPQLGGGPLDVARLSGGTSMTILKLRRGRSDIVLRMPSIPPREDSIRAISREARLLGALRDSDVPHPKLLMYCADNSPIGAPFILMSFVDGWINFGDVIKAPPAFSQPGETQRSLAFAMVDAIATLRNVDYVAAGLQDFGKPEGFLERQVPRYLKLIDSYKVTENHPGRVIPGLEYVVDWLQRNTPAMSATALIHGDLGFHNILFERQAPARVATLLDWEVATLGDPLLDLARAIFSFPGKKIGSGKGRFGDLSAYPTREELIAHYAARTGADVSAMDYYIVLSIFRLCALVEWNYARAINGRDHSGLAQSIADHILVMMALAEEIARAA